MTTTDTTAADAAAANPTSSDATSPDGTATGAQAPVDAVTDTVAVAVPSAPGDAPDDDGRTPLSAGRVTLAAALATAAAAWMTGGIFRDGTARGVGLAGIATAVALLLASRRSVHATALQVLVLPAAVVVGALLVLPSAHGGATIPSLVTDALRAGGILQPPIAFDPGWRLVLVVLFAGLCASAASLALSTDRAMIAVALPLPVVAVPALVQPPDVELLSVGGSVVLLAAALACAYGADLSRQADLGASFERSRLLRGGALLVALLVAVVAVGRVGILFPEPNRSHVVPPQPPQPAPPQADRELFTVRYTQGPAVPLRLGVLDVYDTGRHEWLLPSYDTGRLHTLHPPAALTLTTAAATTATPAIDVDVAVADLGGHDLPAVSNADRLSGIDTTVLEDPRTGSLRLADQPLSPGDSYHLHAPGLPTAKQLEAAAAPPADVAEQLVTPPPPSEVTTLLRTAPSGAFDRMQFLRQALYGKVIAAGQGQPVPLPPDRLGAMLRGATASPFEITAAEALLARYAGVPARIGFGYEPPPGPASSRLSIHPNDGSAWLEAYFTGYGWVPIVGVPPHAQASLDRQQHSTDPSITPSDRLGLVVYVPVRVQTHLLAYEQVQYWVVRILPGVLALLLLLAAVPVGAKRWRAAQRRRWALGNGRTARIAVAYCELRDGCRDLGIGDPTATPLGFLAAVEPDPEHDELAWLVTRTLWGDLARDLRDVDVEVAEEMAQSVRRRIVRAQPYLDRVLGAVARTSLSDPWSREIPACWPESTPRLQLRGRLRLRRWGRPRRVAGRAAAAAAAAVVLVALVAAGNPGSRGVIQPASTPAAAASADATLDALVPAVVSGLSIQREPSAEGAYRSAGPDSEVTAGHVSTIHNGDVVEGSVQVTLLKNDVATEAPELRDGLQQHLGSSAFSDMTERALLYDGSCRCPGYFHPVLVRDQDLHHRAHIVVATLPDQRIYLWYPPNAHAMEIVVLRSEFSQTSADALVLSLSDHQYGDPLAPVPAPPSLTPTAAPSASPGSAGQPGALPGGTP